MLNTQLRLLLAAAACAAIVGGRPVAAQTTEDLKRMSLQDLLEVEVTTVSRGPKPTALVPAAVFVITRDDIRRSGATTLAQALQLAPGLQVARIDAGRWAIGIRGFGDRLARSMLVLIDGRAVYSPLFAGTYWEVQDTALPDVERIEVIRGPGGTLWGANAFNGIINIITSPAARTQGLLVQAGSGSADRGLATVRYGGAAGRMHYRMYGKGLSRNPEFSSPGVDTDHWDMGQAGFRADWSPARERSLTLQGDAYIGRLGQRAAITRYAPPFVETAASDASLSGGNVLARYAGRLGAGGFELQAYYDVTSRNEVPVGERRHTFDVDFQHVRPFGRRHELTWGLGSRVTSGLISAIAPTEFFPARRTDGLYSLFVQDDIALLRERLHATVGSKLEHNDYSGIELQPSVRLLWTPAAAHTVFGAVTRGVRTPSRVETDYTTISLAGTQPLPVFVRLQPNPAFEPERQVAYEAGYRLRPTGKAYFTFSGFFNDLADLLSAELLTPVVEPTPPPLHAILPVQFGNGLHGSSYGAELTADVRPATWWRLAGSYSLVRIAVTRNAASRDVSQEKRYEGFSPRHQVQVLSSWDLRGGWSADAWLRRVSDLPAGPVPAYTTFDARLAWQAAPGLELAVVGRNLNRAHHPEWVGGIAVQRSIGASFTWRR